ncbi:peptidase M22, glycoprotease [Candidatus Koribacter versatilis Ellin345]|uniref:Peptidase M22, glycoprotease n=1 Tax=Koribacter versatilis (strain Ellin345) TaxID=204669 RepID=Q1IP36_KORVE|nr:tRNA (adenosine(37)-N6)-threonylcarbamoyltransferase complex dimerization subunit type 1 TsaB [Candidatus Koribacter versatilis]ABF41364.1 peptidase M22, glycoprotease [Candidatus Koribacter versatilis Ellin345]
MILLTIDTSGKQGSLGLSRRDEQGIHVLAAESLTSGQYSAELIPKFAAMLDRAALKKSDMHAFAVVAGPGSFTGLRVGLAAAKGFAEALNKPLTALSTLELIAAASQRESGSVVAAMDAGRSEIFLGHCEIHPKLEIRTLAELLVKQSELGDRVRELRAPMIVADEKIASFAREARLDVQDIPAPGVELAAALAFAQLDRGVTVRPDDLDANYIRRSDAEIFSATNL